MGGFQSLRIWNKSHELMMSVHEVTQKLPSEEKFRLKNQIERSCASIGANIAEAYNSYYYKDKIKTLYIARKEAGETQNHLKEMETKKYLSQDQSNTLIGEYEDLIKSINAYINYIRRKSEIPPDNPIS